MRPAVALRQLKIVGTISSRIRGSAVAWSWVFNGLRLASGILLLPLLLAYLSEPDLGMYYLLLSLNAVGPLMDFGFLTTINRGVGFAMGGARELQVFGVPDPQSEGTGPNYELLWKLLHTTRWLYRMFAIGLLAILGVVGTYIVSHRVQETSSATLTWIAWGLTLFATCFELYSSWWNIFLRGMNYVLPSTRILVLAYAIRVIVSCALLISGGGLLSIPAAAVVTGLLVRFWSRRACLALLSQHRSASTSRREILNMLKVLWPNTWRIGIHYFSSYLTTNANTLICVHYFGLTGNAKYGLSIQILNVAASMASVWTAVKWPLLQQLRARRDLATMREVVRPRIWLQTGFYVLMAGTGVLLASYLLEHFSTGKSVLPVPWFALLALVVFFDMNFTFWSALIATENRTPFLWAAVISNVLSLALTLVLVNATDLGLKSFVLAPLVAGLPFNYWFWSFAGARTNGTGLLRLLFTRRSQIA